MGKLKVIKAFPPNYAQIRRAFPFIKGRSIYFAFGDRIYNPGGEQLSEALLIHEHVHGRRQENDPLKWWDKYIASIEFRLGEEVAAHRAEYDFLSQNGFSEKTLNAVIERLCSPLYAFGISFQDADRLVR